MRWRHAVLDEPDARLLVHSSQFLGIDPIALRAFRAAELEPGGQDARLALEDAKQHFLMIAGEEDRSGRCGAVDAQALDHACGIGAAVRSEEHTSELQSLMRISYAVFCLKKKIHT